RVTCDAKVDLPSACEPQDGARHVLDRRQALVHVRRDAHGDVRFDVRGKLHDAQAIEAEVFLDAVGGANLARRLEVSAEKRGRALERFLVTRHGPAGYQRGATASWIARAARAGDGLASR